MHLRLNESRADNWKEIHRARMKDMLELPIKLEWSWERTSSLSPSCKKLHRCVLTTHVEVHDLKGSLSFSHETPHELDSLSDMHLSSDHSLDVLTREQVSVFKRASGTLDRITGLLQQLIDIELRKQCSPAKSWTVDASVILTAIWSEACKTLVPTCMLPIQHAKQTVLSVPRPTPHNCRPELSRAHKLNDISKEIGTLVSHEPMWTESLVASTLSVKDMVILTDTWPEALETSPMLKRETPVKCARPMRGSVTDYPCSKSPLAAPRPEWPPFMPTTREALVAFHCIPSDGELQLSSQQWPAIREIAIPLSPTSAGPLQPSLCTTALVVIQEAGTEAPNQAEPCQQPIMCVGAPALVIPSSLAQESLLDDSECTCSWKKPKEPDKAPGVWPQELLCSKLKETWSLTPSSVGSAPCICPSPSTNPWTDRAKRLSPSYIISKMNKTSISKDSPCPKAAPTLPTNMPACSSQAPSLFHSRKVVPQWQDTKDVANKLKELSVSWLSPMFKTAPALSNAMPPVLLLPLGPSLSLEEGETVPKREERQLVSAAVSKTNTSVTRCSPVFYAVPMLPKPKSTSIKQPGTPVPGGSTPRPTRLPLATDPLTQHVVKPIRPVVRDKISMETVREQSWVPYPNAASHSCISSFPSFSLKTDVSKWLVPVNTVHKKQRRVTSHSPGLQTVPVPLDTPPTRPMWAIPCIPPVWVEPRRWIESIVNKIDLISDEYSLVAYEATLRQPCPIRTMEGSKECSQGPSMLHVTAPTDGSAEKEVFSGHANSSTDAHGLPSLLTAPMPNLEPIVTSWAQQLNSIHSSDTLFEEDIMSECSAMGYLSLSQARLKAAIKQPPEPWLIDNIAALTCAHLAAPSTSDEFTPWLSRHSPDRLSAVEQWHSCSVISEIDRMSDKYSPVSHETAPQQSPFHKAEERPREHSEPEFISWALEAMLPDMLHKAEPVSRHPTVGCLSSPQARPKTAIEQFPQSWLINRISALRCMCLVTCSTCDEFGLQFPRYPPNVLPGMDKQCSSDIINKMVRMSTHYLPSSKAAPSLHEISPAALLQVSILCLGFNGHKPSSSFIKGEGQLKESVVSKRHRASVTYSLVHETAQMLLVPEPAASPKAPSHSPCILHKPLDTMGPKQQCPEHIDANNAGMEFASQMAQTMEGLCPPEPTSVHCSHLLDRTDLEPDGRLHWKPSDSKELGQHSSDVIRLGDKGMSRLYSPGFKMALMLSVPELVTAQWASTPPCHFLDMLLEIVMTQWLMLHMSIIRIWNSLMEEGSQLPEPLQASQHQSSGFRFNLWPPWKLPGMMEMEWHAKNVIKLRNNRMSSRYSPGPEMALTPSAPLPYPHSPHDLRDMMQIRWRTGGTDVISTYSCGVEGSHLLEPLPAHTSDVKLDRRLLWKLPDTEWVERCCFCIVHVKNNESSVLLHSPNIKTVVMPPAHSHNLLDLKPDRRLCWKPLVLKKLGWQYVNVIKPINNRMSRAYLPGSKTAHALLTAEPTVYPCTPLLLLHDVLSWLWLGWDQCQDHAGECPQCCWCSLRVSKSSQEFSESGWDLSETT